MCNYSRGYCNWECSGAIPLKLPFGSCLCSGVKSACSFSAQTPTSIRKTECFDSPNIKRTEETKPWSYFQPLSLASDSRDGLPRASVVAEMLFEFGLLFVLGQWKCWTCGHFQGFDDVSFRLGLLSRLCRCVLMWFDSLRFFLRPFYTDCQPKCASCPRKACDWPMQAEIHLVVSRLLALQLWQSIAWSVWQVCFWYSESEKSTRKSIES